MHVDNNNPQNGRQFTLHDVKIKDVYQPAFISGELEADSYDNSHCLKIQKRGAVSMEDATNVTRLANYFMVHVNRTKTNQEQIVWKELKSNEDEDKASEKRIRGIVLRLFNLDSDPTYIQLTHVRNKRPTFSSSKASTKLCKMYIETFYRLPRHFQSIKRIVEALTLSHYGFTLENTWLRLLMKARKTKIFRQMDAFIRGMGYSVNSYILLTEVRLMVARGLKQICMSPFDAKFS